ncbi:hypothetical protein AXF42_Ash019803 [Apostasia shenzhenica]|uniref:Uncharacterized protein n=1 Tax=Apostasia shenzhenica TaxID=1088818 RepID=A0A2I0AA47_9ASPA|nr:hypothetical protein AXF42_Ash019803 [Apostasia shenzhenica]
MEDLEKAVRRAVNIVSASPVGHHVKSQVAFDLLLQTLADVSILNQENIRGSTVLPFCGPKGPDRFFDAGSHGPEEIPPLLIPQPHHQHTFEGTRDYYFFVGGDLGIPIMPGVCPPEFIGDAKWMAGEGTLKNLERLKGQRWPLKGFLRHVKNDISLYAKTLGYAVFKEVVSPPGATLMKRVRRGQPPAVQLCGGTAIDMVSSHEDTANDKMTLAELYAGKGKEPAAAAEPKTVPKSDKGRGIVIGGEKREEKEEGQEGAQKERAEVETASSA